MKTHIFFVLSFFKKVFSALNNKNLMFYSGFHLVTRQMKTITYSLASTKCMEEGWTLRPPSPSLTDDEQIHDPFVIEVNPLQLVSVPTYI